MKKMMSTVLLLSTIWFTCSEGERIVTENPFFVEYDTPFGVPPFEKIKEMHYLPAYEEGMKQQQAEIDAIVSNAEGPTFKNTIIALERSGYLLSKVSYVFDNLKSSNTNENLQSIAREVSPLLTKHQDDIKLNEKLFQKIKKVHTNKAKLNLSIEDQSLLDKYYKEFVRGGADLNEQDKEEFRNINKELALLSLEFGENLLKENNRFELVIDNKDDLSGLTEAIISAAAETAKERGHEGKWAFTLHKPSLIPFLQYSDKRDLREKMFKGYINKGDNNNDLDNKDILAKIVKLRIRRSNLLGYKTHAEYILELNMAKEPQQVYALLQQLWAPALTKAKNEAKDLQSLINKEGGNFKLQPWDWWYYAEKVKMAKYDLDDEQLRPYFKLDNVRDGAFAVANKLYGIKFSELKDIPTYHVDARVFEVKEVDDTFIGLLYTDYFPRESKRSGAWMNSYRKQYRLNGKNINPIICNVCNFTKPIGDKPSLLSLEEVETLFHEFGHALHGLLSNSTYEKLSGTSVPRDFVEMPSQIMENWAKEPEILRMYAKHYQTGEVIPDILIDKIQKSATFNQGFKTVEYLAASFLDMDWHTLENVGDIDVSAFEKKTLDKFGMIPEIVTRYRSTYFQHIFSSGYSSGYYSYIWSEVLDADAFQAFKETSLFDQNTAISFRENILAKGGTEDPMELYKRFRGAEPEIEPILRKRGLQ